MRIRVAVIADRKTEPMHWSVEDEYWARGQLVVFEAVGLLSFDKPPPRGLVLAKPEPEQRATVLNFPGNGAGQTVVRFPTENGKPCPPIRVSDVSEVLELNGYRVVKITP